MTSPIRRENDFLEISSRDPLMELDWVVAEMETKKTCTPRVLLVDDDPIFCHRMTKVARKMGVKIETCHSLSAVAALPNRLPYDVVILDYYFEELTGPQLAFLLDKKLPILLTSSTKLSDLKDPEGSLAGSPNWPMEIKNFSHKTLGPQRILEDAISLTGPELLNPLPEAIDLTPVFWALVVGAIVVLFWSLGIFNSPSPKGPYYWDLDSKVQKIRTVQNQTPIQIRKF